MSKEVSEKLRFPENTTFHIIIKWGCDGSEQNWYKKKFSEEHFTDESLFSICMVPIQVYCGADASKTIIWKSPVPSSTRYCRPIKFVFAQESTNLITSPRKNEVFKYTFPILRQTHQSSQTANGSQSVLFSFFMWAKKWELPINPISAKCSNVPGFIVTTIRHHKTADLSYYAEQMNISKSAYLLTDCYLRYSTYST